MRDAAKMGLVFAPMLLFAQLADAQATEELRQQMHEMEAAKMAESAFTLIHPTEEIKRRLLGIIDSLVEWNWL